MAKEKKNAPIEEIEDVTEQAQCDLQPDAAEEQAESCEQNAEPTEGEAQLLLAQENFLRLAAEYDNFRKRTQKEKDSIYTEVRAETVTKFLPVFDNLERALNQTTSDEAYKKGVELTMGGLIEVMEKLGVVPFGDVGDTFDPNMHNAVMHCEDENLGENVLAEVFQKGFSLGDKIVRFAMVRVAN